MGVKIIVRFQMLNLASGKAIDASFILHSIVNRFLNENKRLYCTFVDLKQCFDSIYINGLWLKLYNMGLNGKLLRAIRSMYQAVKSCVKLCDNYSDFFY